MACFRERTQHPENCYDVQSYEQLSRCTHCFHQLYSWEDTQGSFSNYPVEWMHMPTPFSHMQSSYRMIQWNLCIMDTLGPTKSVLIIKVSWFSRSVYMIKHHLGLELSVWILQVSLFSSVLINRFHCIPQHLINSPDSERDNMYNQYQLHLHMYNNLLVSELVH